MSGGMKVGAMKNVVWLCGFPLVSVMTAIAAYTYGNSYPASPMIPWIGVPQRWFGRALYMPNPPIYAQSVISEQNHFFSDYRWEHFYQTRTTVAPSGPPGTSTAAPVGQECQAITTVNAAGSHHGVCIPASDIARKCPSQLSGEGRGCNLAETCCVEEAAVTEPIIP